MGEARDQNLPTLYHRGKAGGIYSWRVWTAGDEIFTEYGLLGGEKQVARRRATPKNVGRSNATTAEEQARLEARAMWQNKRDRKYSETVEGALAELIRPMLTTDFESRKARNVTYPVFVQPKLDGVRALVFWDEARRAWEVRSRSGKSYRDVNDASVAHIVGAGIRAPEDMG